METTFHNVTICIDAPNPRAAYDKLCDLLAAGEPIEWNTDEYSTNQPEGNHRSTEELFPIEEEVDKEAADAKQEEDYLNDPRQ